MVPACLDGAQPVYLDGALHAWMAPSLYARMVPCMLRIRGRPYARPDPPNHAKIREKRNAQPLTTGARTRYSPLIERVRYPLDYAAKKKMLDARWVRTDDLLLEQTAPQPSRPQRTY